MNKRNLISRLHKNDPLVKFVPFGYKIGEQTWQELGKNPYIIARYGEEGAEKMAKIASEYLYNPKLWIFGFVDKEEKRMSSVGDSDVFGGALLVDDYDWSDDDEGHAFGVLKE